VTRKLSCLCAFRAPLIYDNIGHIRSLPPILRMGRSRFSSIYPYLIGFTRISLVNQSLKAFYIE
jgi:hypothetical protein